MDYTCKFLFVLVSVEQVFKSQNVERETKTSRCQNFRKRHTVRFTETSILIFEPLELRIHFHFLYNVPFVTGKVEYQHFWSKIHHKLGAQNKCDASESELKISRSFVLRLVSLGYVRLFQHGCSQIVGALEFSKNSYSWERDL